MARHAQETQHEAAPPSLTLRQRVLAATGASVLSALVVNPLDVVKVRMQARAAGTDGAPFKSHQAYCFHRSIPVRSSQNVGHMVTPSQATNSLGFKLSSSLTRLLEGPSRLSRQHLANGRTEGWPTPKLAGMSLAPANTCFCAAPGGMGTLRMDVLHEIPTPAVCAQPARTMAPGMLPTLRQITRQEGVSSLWRGLDSALLMSVPTVLLYYPLYDFLLASLSADAKDMPRLGPAAPVLAGAAARTVTVFAVAPLEFVRVQQQAGTRTAGAGTDSVAQLGRSMAGHEGLSTWQALRNSLGDATGAPAALRALPRLWTGLSATIARDVPFSAIYWGLVEPIRGTLLSAQRKPPATAKEPLSSNGTGNDAAAVAAAQLQPALAGASLAAAVEGDTWAVVEQQAVDSQMQSAVVAEPAHPPAGPTHAQLVLANLVAGSLAGATASAATTPFDVVKTRLQLLPAGQPSKSVSAVMREVVQQQGVRGLFVGVGPRAARCAPACAIVIACYEVLKSVMGNSSGP